MLSLLSAHCTSKGSKAWTGCAKDQKEERDELKVKDKAEQGDTGDNDRRGGWK